MKETRKVQPCGMLYSQGREYFLLYPHPITRTESWEKDNAYRWLVVPNKEISRVKHHYENGSFDWVSVYSFARHIVSTAFVVDYAAGMPEIYVETLDEIDVSKQEWQEIGRFSFDPSGPNPLSTEEWEKLLQNAEEARV